MPSTIRSVRDAVHRADRALLIGVVAAMAVMGGATTYLAMLHSPYQTDEPSHVGYVLVLRDGRLPDIDTDVPTEAGGDELAAAVNRPWPFAVPEIHVGQNPPFPYLVAVPLAELSSALDVRAGPLFGVRLLNVLGAMGSIGAAALLGWELSGRSRMVAVTTAGLVSSLVSISALSSVANLDGLALLTTTGTAWGLARFARTRADGDALLLGLWLAAAAATRPMALAIGLVAGLVAAVHAIRDRGVRGSLGPMVRLALPAAVLSGWFYVLNVVRYGDPTGSSAVFEKYGYVGTRGFWDVLWGPEPFIQTVPYLLTDVYASRPWWESTGPREYAITAACVGVVAVATWLALRGSRGVPASVTDGTRRALCPASWVSVAILAAVPMFLVARHMSHGGAGHARYLLPAIPIVLAATALLLTRLNRWLPALVVTAGVAAHLLRLDDAGDVLVPDPSITPKILRAAAIGQPFRAMALAVAAVGAVVLVLSLVQIARRPVVDPVSPAVEPVSSGGSG